MGDLEEICEEKLFELCDARERYPLRCVNELEKCIKLTNEICTMKIPLKKERLFNLSTFTEEQIKLFNVNCVAQKVSHEQQNAKLNKMLYKIDNLKATVEQIEKEKVCEINKLFKE